MIVYPHDTLSMLGEISDLHIADHAPLPPTRLREAKIKTH